MRYFSLSILTTIFFLTACDSGMPVLKTDPKSAMDYAERSVSFGNRISGSGEIKAYGDWILHRLSSLPNCKVSKDVFTEQTPDGMIRFRNLIAEIPGKTEKFVIIGAHYDIKRFESFPFTGANDGGSGVSALLIMADALAKSRVMPYFTLRFVFFDGEECRYDYTENDGLHGSRHYADLLEKRGEVKKCRAMILLDMIGDRDLSIAPPVNSDRKLLALFRKAAKETGNTGHIADCSHAMLDDHVPFLEKGIPSIDLIDFSYGPDNAYWHTQEDSLDRISGESIAKTADIVLRMLRELD